MDSGERTIRIGAFPFTPPGYAACETATEGAKSKVRETNPGAKLSVIMITRSSTSFEVWLDITTR